MKTAVVAVLALTLACRPQQPSASAPAPGASTPRAAVDGILGALKSGDIQAVTTMWGTARGPVRDDSRFKRAELEQRIVLMQRCFSHDSYRVVGQVAGQQGGQGFEVDLRRGANTRRTRINAVQAKKGKRWFVDNLDVDAVRDFCQQGRAATSGR